MVFLFIYICVCIIFTCLITMLVSELDIPDLNKLKYIFALWLCNLRREMLWAKRTGRVCYGRDRSEGQIGWRRVREAVEKGVSQTAAWIMCSRSPRRHCCLAVSLTIPLLFHSSFSILLSFSSRVFILFLVMHWNPCSSLLSSKNNTISPPFSPPSLHGGWMVLMYCTSLAASVWGRSLPASAHWGTQQACWDHSFIHSFCPLNELISISPHHSSIHSLSYYFWTAPVWPLICWSFG